MSAVALQDFLDAKAHSGSDHGFDPLWMPSNLFPFQESLVEWDLRKGRSASFIDCGMGKSALEAVEAENIARKTGRPVLILTPLAVAPQMVRECEKFGVEAKQSKDGTVHRITVANWQKLHLFNPEDFAGVLGDESGILKSFEGTTKRGFTEFARKIQYRSLKTANGSPNNFIELGTHSEALGYMGYMDMLAKFMKNDNNNNSSRRMYGEAPKWRFKGHAEIPFWRWVCSWGRAARKPSDLGFDDGPFKLPALHTVEHLVETDYIPEGQLFSMPANTLPTQRAEKRGSLRERCEMAASLVRNTGKPFAIWCQLNEEADLLKSMLPDAVEVSGREKSDDIKEDKLLSFSSGNVRGLITKARVAGWGLNLQHCAHTVYFPSHSYEEYYQSVRRFWRFGQKAEVTVDIPLTEGEKLIMANLTRKADDASRMFDSLVREMNFSIAQGKRAAFENPVQIPGWF